MFVSRLMVRIMPGISLSILLTWTASIASAQEPAADTDETVVFFESGRVPELKLIIDDQGQQRLREAPREYATCSLSEKGATTLKGIVVKLKGAAGSYDEFDDRPGLTLKINKFKKGQRFHGMEKFHLNNAAQDESFLSEWLGSELFRQAGYPAPRVGHAHLWINDREMGLYVIREGFDQPFMERSFGSNDGNLYDGGFLQDIDSPLELDSGPDPDGREDLVRLALACFSPDPEKRKTMIEERLDIDRFLTFMALERLCGHWDGYSLNTNNYRIFFPMGGKGVLLPHGMDQLFQDPEAGLFDHSGSLLGAAIMQNDQLRQRYREQVTNLAKLFQPNEVWLKKIDAQRERLAPILAEIDPNLAEAHEQVINELKDRFKQRAESLTSLIEGGMPSPIEFDPKGEISLTEWNPTMESENVKLEEETVADVACFCIERELFGDFSSSWRKTILLPRGKFCFEARIKTENVIPIPDSEGRGAGIRLSQSGRANALVGSSDWTAVSHEFEVAEDQRMVELVLELRARTGKAYFDRDSLKIKRNGDLP